MNTLFDYMPNKTASNLLDGIAGYEDGGFVGLEHGGIYHDDESLRGEGSGLGVDRDEGSDSGVDYSGEPDFGGQDRGPTGTSGSNITPANLGVGGMSQGMLQNIMLAGGGDALAGGLNNMNFTTATPDATSTSPMSTGSGPYGGSVNLSNFLTSQGIGLSPEQMAVMQQYDPSGVQRAAQNLSSSLLGMTQQNLASQAGAGFAGATGASQYRAGQASGQAQQALADTTQQSIRDYQSQVLGDVGDLVAGGADIRMVAPTTNPNWNPPSGATNYTFEGKEYKLINGNWQSVDQMTTDVEDTLTEQAQDPQTVFGAAQDILENPISGASNYVGGKVFDFLSDKRMKKDINYLFTMSNNVPIYTFKYKNSDDIHIGTMAQDIEGFIPDAVSEVNGYKMVNYNKVFNYNG
jgi:hypothetical protein